jgi:hypothetical protein
MTEPDDEELQRLLDALGPMGVADAGLLKLGDAIGDPTKAAPGQVVLFLLGHRATSLYRNFVHSLDGPADIGPILAIRPLVEMAILAKWVSLDPPLHGELWFGHSDARDVTAMQESERHLQIRSKSGLDPQVILDDLRKRAASRDEAAERARVAGKNYGGKPMPPLDRLVLEVERADPGHRVAIRQAYDLAYRAMSPWTHSEATSFKSTASGAPGAVTYHGDVSPFLPEMIHVMAGMLFAYVLEVVGAAAGDGSDKDAREWRAMLTIYPMKANEAAPA